MKTRALIECTIDTASPAAELSAAINAVLAVLPTPDQRMAVLQTLGDDIGRALADYEAANKPEEDGE
ncbi:hypothetical protein D3C81_1086100 [compost metagenome]